MRLSTSLRVEPGQILSFVGAGGKTSAIARLVKELAPSLPVLATTTTHLGAGQRSLAKHHLLQTNAGWKHQLEQHLSSKGSVLLTGSANPEGKWTAPTDEALEFARQFIVDRGGVLLVEADGARSLLLKAPAEHEPAIPPFTTVTILVASSQVIGRPLSGDVVHRPELAGPIMGLEPGESIKVEHVVRLLTSPSGGMKGVPEPSTLKCLLNISTRERQDDARQDLAQRLLREARISAVLLCDLAQDDPVGAVYGRTGAVILAAGGSKRFSRQKLLEPWRGEPLIRHVVRSALQTGVSPVLVVTGAERERLREALSDLPVETVDNPHWQEGQAGSLQVGLAALKERVDAVVFMLGDMPLVEPALIEALIEEHRCTLAPIIAPGYAGRPGNPVLFDRDTFGALEAIRGDQGGRALYNQFEPRWLEWGATAVTDVDTLEDLRRLDAVSKDDAS